MQLINININPTFFNPINIIEYYNLLFFFVANANLNYSLLYAFNMTNFLIQNKI
jgi:hypothetical protein